MMAFPGPCATLSESKLQPFVCWTFSGLITNICKGSSKAADVAGLPKAAARVEERDGGWLVRLRL